MNGLDTEQLIERCARLADGFAGRAERHDREGSFPVEDFADIRADGLLGIMVPTSHGGMGADFVTYTRVLERLAMGNAATALTFNMHNIVTGGVAEMALDEVPGRHGERMRTFADWLFDEAVTHRKLFASATTEPGTGTRFSQLATTYRRVDGGYELDGTKSFVSMAGHADYYVIAARSAETSGGPVPALSFFAVDASSPGIEIEESWDVMGMRATASHTLHLRNVGVPADRLFLGSEGMGFYKLLHQPHWTVGGYNGAYLGIATAVMEFTTSYLRGKRIPGTERTMASDPVIQHQVGEMEIAHASARAITMEAARLVTEQPGSTEANVAIHRAKYLVSEVAPRLASMAIRICGGSTIARRYPLERLYRDARCGGLMPARSDDCLSYVGKAALGVDVTRPEESYW